MTAAVDAMDVVTDANGAPTTQADQAGRDIGASTPANPRCQAGILDGARL